MMSWESYGYTYHDALDTTTTSSCSATSVYPAFEPTRGTPTRKEQYEQTKHAQNEYHHQRMGSRPAWQGHLPWEGEPPMEKISLEAKVTNDALEGIKHTEPFFVALKEEIDDWLDVDLN